MKAFRFAVSVVALLGALPAFAEPKHILISDSLLANADQWNVKRNNYRAGMNSWQFGEFGAAKSNVTWITGGADTNFFRTKSVRHSEQKSSFVMRNQAGDSALVNFARQVVSQSNPGLDLGHGTHVGGTGQTVETDHFIASIAIGRDTAEVWNLVIGETDVAEWGYDRSDLASHSSILAHGDRRIALVPVFSRKLAAKKSFGEMLRRMRVPGMGYEFIENGRSLCAVEYFSSGLLGPGRNTVWMARDADPRLRLVLAAAMASVLELKCAMQESDPATRE